MVTTTPGHDRTASGGGSLRNVYELAVAGALGAVFGLYLYVELVDTPNLWRRDALAGVFLGGTLGYALNAAGPLRDGAWLKLFRASTWGAIAGAAGGAGGLVIGEIVLGGLKGGPMGRAVSWSILGLGIGLSQGLAERSRQRLILGLIGGGLGGFVGGLSFELLRDRIGSTHRDLSQPLGVVIMGAGLGLCLALVERALRRSWVTVVRGRQEGRSYLLSGGRTGLGLDERAEVGLFGDPTVARRHAAIEGTGRGFALRNLDPANSTRVNGIPVADKPRDLADGDKIELGETVLVFRQR